LELLQCARHLVDLQQHHRAVRRRDSRREALIYRTAAHIAADDEGQRTAAYRRCARRRRGTRCVQRGGESNGVTRTRESPIRVGTAMDES